MSTTLSPQTDDILLATDSWRHLLGGAADQSGPGGFSLPGEWLESFILKRFFDDAPARVSPNSVRVLLPRNQANQGPHLSAFFQGNSFLPTLISESRLKEIRSRGTAAETPRTSTRPASSPRTNSANRGTDNVSSLEQIALELESPAMLQGELLTPLIAAELFPELDQDLFTSAIPRNPESLLIGLQSNLPEHFQGQDTVIAQPTSFLSNRSPRASSEFPPRTQIQAAQSAVQALRTSDTLASTQSLSPSSMVSLAPGQTYSSLLPLGMASGLTADRQQPVQYSSGVSVDWSSTGVFQPEQVFAQPAGTQATWEEMEVPFFRPGLPDPQVLQTGLRFLSKPASVSSVETSEQPSSSLRPQLSQAPILPSSVAQPGDRNRFTVAMSPASTSATWQAQVSSAEPLLATPEVLPSTTTGRVAESSIAPSPSTVVSSSADAFTVSAAERVYSSPSEPSNAGIQASQSEARDAATIPPASVPTGNDKIQTAAAWFTSPMLAWAAGVQSVAPQLMGEAQYYTPTGSMADRGHTELLSAPQASQSADNTFVSAPDVSTRATEQSQLQSVSSSTNIMGRPSGEFWRSIAEDPQENVKSASAASTGLVTGERIGAFEGNVSRNRISGTSLADVSLSNAHVQMLSSSSDSMPTVDDLTAPFEGHQILREAPERRTLLQFLSQDLDAENSTVGGVLTPESLDLRLEPQPIIASVRQALGMVTSTRRLPDRMATEAPAFEERTVSPGVSELINGLLEPGSRTPEELDRVISSLSMIDLADSLGKLDARLSDTIWPVVSAVPGSPERIEAIKTATLLLNKAPVSARSETPAPALSTTSRLFNTPNQALSVPAPLQAQSASRTAATESVQTADRSVPLTAMVSSERPSASLTWSAAGDDVSPQGRVNFIPPAVEAALQLERGLRPVDGNATAQVSPSDRAVADVGYPMLRAFVPATDADMRSLLQTLRGEPLNLPRESGGASAARTEAPSIPRGLETSASGSGIGSPQVSPSDFEKPASRQAPVFLQSRRLDVEEVLSRQLDEQASIERPTVKPDRSADTIRQLRQALAEKVEGKGEVARSLAIPSADVGPALVPTMSVQAPIETPIEHAVQSIADANVVLNQVHETAPTSALGLQSQGLEFVSYSRAVFGAENSQTLNTSVSVPDADATLAFGVRDRLDSPLVSNPAAEPASLSLLIDTLTSRPELLRQESAFQASPVFVPQAQRLAQDELSEFFYRLGMPLPTNGFDARTLLPAMTGLTDSERVGDRSKPLAMIPSEKSGDLQAGIGTDIARASQLLTLLSRAESDFAEDLAPTVVPTRIAQTRSMLMRALESDPLQSDASINLLSELLKSVSPNQAERAQVTPAVADTITGTSTPLAVLASLTGTAMHALQSQAHRADAVVASTTSPMSEANPILFRWLEQVRQVQSASTDMSGSGLLRGYVAPASDSRAATAASQQPFSPGLVAAIPNALSRETLSWLGLATMPGIATDAQAIGLTPFPNEGRNQSATRPAASDANAIPAPSNLSLSVIQLIRDLTEAATASEGKPLEGAQWLPQGNNAAALFELLRSSEDVQAGLPEVVRAGVASALNALPPTLLTWLQRSAQSESPSELTSGQPVQGSRAFTRLGELLRAPLDTPTGIEAQRVGTLPSAQTEPGQIVAPTALLSGNRIGRISDMTSDQYASLESPLVDGRYSQPDTQTVALVRTSETQPDEVFGRRTPTLLAQRPGESAAAAQETTLSGRTASTRPSRLLHPSLQRTAGQDFATVLETLPTLTGEVSPETVTRPTTAVVSTEQDGDRTTIAPVRPMLRRSEPTADGEAKAWLASEEAVYDEEDYGERPNMGQLSARRPYESGPSIDQLVRGFERMFSVTRVSEDGEAETIHRASEAMIVPPQAARFDGSTPDGMGSLKILLGRLPSDAPVESVLPAAQRQQTMPLEALSGRNPSQPVAPVIIDSGRGANDDSVQQPQASSLTESLARAWGVALPGTSVENSPLTQVLLTREPIMREVTGESQEVYAAPKEHGHHEAPKHAMQDEKVQQELDIRGMEQAVAELRWRLQLNEKWDEERE